MRPTSLTALLALVLLTGCRSDTPEAQVRKAFETCRKAVEAGDATAATEALDPSFQGPEGMDKGSARLFLMGTFRQEKVGITVVRNDVSIQRNEAQEDVDLVLTSQSGSLLPQETSHRAFRLRWRKADGKWRLVELQPD